MALRGQLTLTLVLDLESEQLHGSLAEDTGERREFAGWLQLASAVESALASARDRTGAHPAPGEGRPTGGAP